MSEGVIISPAGERIEISQTSREILLLSPVPRPSLIITPACGGQVTLSQTVQSLILSEAHSETLVIREEGGDTLLISDDGGSASLYGRPYTQAEGSIYYYYAWQHKDGTRWKAQRFELNTTDLRSLTGDNPQPDDLGAFQALSW